MHIHTYIQNIFRQKVRSFKYVYTSIFCINIYPYTCMKTHAYINAHPYPYTYAIYFQIKAVIIYIYIHMHIFHLNTYLYMY